MRVWSMRRARIANTLNQRAPRSPSQHAVGKRNAEQSEAEIGVFVIRSRLILSAHSSRETHRAWPRYSRPSGRGCHTSSRRQIAGHVRQPRRPTRSQDREACIGRTASCSVTEVGRYAFASGIVKGHFSAPHHIRKQESEVSTFVTDIISKTLLPSRASPGTPEYRRKPSVCGLHRSRRRPRRRLCRAHPTVCFSASKNRIGRRRCKAFAWQEPPRPV